MSKLSNDKIASDMWLDYVETCLKRYREFAERLRIKGEDNVTEADVKQLNFYREEMIGEAADLNRFREYAMPTVCAKQKSLRRSIPSIRFNNDDTYDWQEANVYALPLQNADDAATAKLEAYDKALKNIKIVRVIYLLGQARLFERSCSLFIDSLSK